jgi:hypothetical protein
MRADGATRRRGWRPEKYPGGPWRRLAVVQDPRVRDVLPYAGCPPAARRLGDGIGGKERVLAGPWPTGSSDGKPLASLHLGLVARASTWRPGAGCGQPDPSKRESPAGEVRERPNRSHC